MASTIPLQPVASQMLAVTLAGQPVTLNVYQKSTGLYIDVLLNSALVVGGVVARDGARIVRDAYLGLVGDLAFIDTQGAEDPVYTGFGTRWILVYLAAGE